MCGHDLFGHVHVAHTLHTWRAGRGQRAPHDAAGQRRQGDGPADHSRGRGAGEGRRPISPRHGPGEAAVHESGQAPQSTSRITLDFDPLLLNGDSQERGSFFEQNKNCWHFKTKELPQKYETSLDVGWTTPDVWGKRKGAKIRILAREKKWRQDEFCGQI